MYIKNIYQNRAKDIPFLWDILQEDTPLLPADRLG